MYVRIETRRIPAVKFREKRRLIASVPNVITNVIGVREREHDQIVPLSVAERARARRLSFLVLGFPVNDRRDRFARVFADAFPNAHHVAASSVDNLAAALFDLLQHRQFGAERRHDHDIVGLQIGNLGLLVTTSQILDA